MRGDADVRIRVSLGLERGLGFSYDLLDLSEGMVLLDRYTILDRIAGGGTLLDRMGTAHGLDEIRAVVVGDVLQGIGNARNHIRFANDRHALKISRTGPQIYQDVSKPG